MSAPQSRSQRVNKRKRPINEQPEPELQTDQSATANGSEDLEENESKTSKRACNECRQQKVSFYHGLVPKISRVAL